MGSPWNIISIRFLLPCQAFPASGVRAVRTSPPRASRGSENESSGSFYWYLRRSRSNLDIFFCSHNHSYGVCYCAGRNFVARASSCVLFDTVDCALYLDGRATQNRSTRVPACSCTCFSFPWRRNTPGHDRITRDPA